MTIIKDLTKQSQLNLGRKGLYGNFIVLLLTTNFLWRVGSINFITSLSISTMGGQTMITEEKKLLQEAKDALKHYRSVLDDYDQNGMIFQQGFDENGKPVTQIEVANRMIIHFEKKIKELKVFDED